MFSKEESKKIRQEFWTSFGQKYPHKWLLYNTKIKDVTLKFTFTTKKAQVSMDIEPSDSLLMEYYYDKLVNLKTILTSEYLENVIYDQNYNLENGKIISRVYVELSDVSIHNRNNWEETMKFLAIHMRKLETFFMEYKDFLKS